MGGVFSKPKPIEAPAVPAPPPIPSAPEAVQIGGAGEQAQQEQARRSGLSKTFLTGNLTPKPTKKTTLG